MYEFPGYGPGVDLQNKSLSGHYSFSMGPFLRRGTERSTHALFHSRYRDALRTCTAHATQLPGYITPKEDARNVPPLAPEYNVHAVELENEQEKSS